jgi:hypothetical protein
MIPHRLHVWLAFVLLYAVLGCRRDGPIEAPPNFSARLAERLLGAPAEVAFFVDIAAIRRDAVYGRMFTDRRVGEHRDLRWLASRIDRIDVWLLDIHGAADDFSGLAVLRSGRLGEADFGAGGVAIDLDRRLVLPTGVIMHVDTSRNLQTAIFLVDGDLVLAAGAAIAPTQNHLSSSRALPPSLAWGRDALAGVHGLPPALARLGPDYSAHATAASLVWRTGHGGELVASAAFDDEASSERALRYANELPDARLAHQTRCAALTQVGVAIEHDRRSVTVRLTGLRDVIAAFLDETCN